MIIKERPVILRWQTVGDYSGSLSAEQISLFEVRAKRIRSRLENMVLESLSESHASPSVIDDSWKPLVGP